MSVTESVERSTTQDFFRPRRLGHANLYVNDYLAAQKFYYEVAGFNEAYRQPDNLASFVSNGNSYHDLTLVDVHSHYNSAHEPPGLNHIAFELETEADLAAGWRRAVAAGHEFRAADHDVAHSLYAADPDGNGVEIYADVVKNWRAVRSGIIIKQKPKYVPGVTSPALTERFYPQNPQIATVPDAMFHSRKCSHVLLVTANFEAMFAYYRDVVGLRAYVGDAHAPYAIMAGTNSVGDVTLMRQRPGLGAGAHHVGLELPSEADLERGAAMAAAAGIAIEHSVDHPARRAVYIRDPSGITLQFHVDRDWRPETVAGMDEATALLLL